MERIAGVSAPQLARTAGALYLANIVGGAFAIGVVPALLVVAGNAAGTAHNIQAHELLYRSGLAAHVLIDVTAVLMAVIFYDLFKVVSRRLALLLVYFTIVGTAVEVANLLNQFVPLILLDRGRGSSAFTVEQLQALAYMPNVLATVGYDLSSVFFAGYGLTIGYLVFRSTFLPRALGVLLAVGASCYLAYGLADILSPALAGQLVPYIQLPSLVGEGSFSLWLLIAGVNLQRWREQAGATTLQGSGSAAWRQESV